MNNYDRRWLHAFTWAKKLKELFETGNYILEFDKEYINPNETKIDINEENQSIHLRSKCFSCMIYEGNLDYDHGAYTPIKEFKKQIIDNIKLYKMEIINI